MDKFRNRIGISKYVFTYLLVIFSYMTTHSIIYIMVGLFESSILILFYDYIISKNRLYSILIAPLLLLFNLEYLVLIFGNSFITLTMLENLVFVQDLSGKVVIYGIGIFLVVLFSVIPGDSIFDYQKYKKRFCVILAILLFFEIWLYRYYKEYYVFYNVQKVISDEIRFRRINLNGSAGNEEILNFYNEKITNAISKDATIVDKPNVVVIFTEGLSQSVIDDERGITPNIKEFENNSIRFENYYNHTFATLRGIQGQLYSGYQLEDLDVNNLVSLQSVFSDYGYHTAFINVEPNNSDFTKYLNEMSFDEVISDKKHTTGYTEAMTDDEAYTLLIDSMENLEGKNKPFLLGIYTYGTHATFDSLGVKWNDGSDKVLNKFYNLDVQFGKFIEWFNQSSMSDNTIIIFTSDHATYADQDFVKAFPNHERVCTDLDEIPFCIYYKGVSDRKINVNGRNSLSFAPTVLDFLDMDSSNYFLGDSLFKGEVENDNYDTIFFDASYVRTTYGGRIETVSEDYIDGFLEGMLPYFYAMSDYSTIEDGAVIDAELRDGIIEIYLNNYAGDDSIQFALWSNKYDQDDLIWVNAKKEDDSWHASVPVDMLNNDGTMSIHAYDKKYICRKTVVVNQTPVYQTCMEIENDTKLIIKMNDGKELDNVQIAIRNSDGNGMDTQWYDAEYKDDKWVAEVNIDSYNKNGKLNIQIYGFDDSNNSIMLRELNPKIANIHN